VEIFNFLIYKLEGKNCFRNGKKIQTFEAELNFFLKKPLVFYKPIYPLQPFGDLLKQNMMRN
jgi:hypothetical protein